MFHSVGELSDYYTEWRFSESKQLVGVYGWEKEHIYQLGFIALDTECVLTGVPSVFEDEIDTVHEPQLENQSKIEVLPAMSEGDFKCKLGGKNEQGGFRLINLELQGNQLLCEEPNLCSCEEASLPQLMTLATVKEELNPLYAYRFLIIGGLSVLLLILTMLLFTSSYLYKKKLKHVKDAYHA